MELFVDGFCGDTFESCVSGHSVFVRGFDLALDKRNNVFDEFVGDIVAFFVDPFARDTFFCVCNVFEVNKGGNAFIDSVFGFADESDHFSGFAGNGGVDCESSGKSCFVTVGFGSCMACAALEKGKFDSADFCAGFCTDDVGHGCGKTAELGMTELVDDVGVVDAVFADEFAVFVADTFGEYDYDTFVVFLEFVKVGKEFIHIENNFGKIDESGTFAADFGECCGTGKPSCVTAHNFDYDDGVTVIYVNVLDDLCDGKGNIFCGRTEAGAMVGHGKVVIDGFRNTDDAAFVILGRHIFGYLVAGIHTVVTAVIEEIADVIFFEDFEDSFIVGIVLAEIFELITAASDKGSGGGKHKFEGFGIFFSHIDDAVIENAADSVLCGKDFGYAFFTECGFDNAVCTGVDNCGRAAGLTDKTCADKFAHKIFAPCNLLFFAGFLSFFKNKNSDSVYY